MNYLDECPLDCVHCQEFADLSFNINGVTDLIYIESVIARVKLRIADAENSRIWLRERLRTGMRAVGCRKTMERGTERFTKAKVTADRARYDSLTKHIGQDEYAIKNILVPRLRQLQMAAGVGSASMSVPSPPAPTSKHIAEDMRLHIERERQRANTIRHQLTRDHPCPYCQGELGDSPQCDHIIPLTLWGRSVEWNMVWVCARCNLKKGGRGLNEFVEAEKLNRVMIFWALKQLGKRL